MYKLCMGTVRYNYKCMTLEDLILNMHLTSGLFFWNEGGEKR